MKRATAVISFCIVKRKIIASVEFDWRNTKNFGDFKFYVKCFFFFVLLRILRDSFYFATKVGFFFIIIRFRGFPIVGQRLGKFLSYDTLLFLSSFASYQRVNVIVLSGTYTKCFVYMEYKIHFFPVI